MSDLSSPVARGPIAVVGPRATSDGWEVAKKRANGSFTITDQTPLPKFSVRASADGEVRHALATPFGRAIRRRPWGLVVGSGPGEWLVLGPLNSASELHLQLIEMTESSGEFASVVELTHGRALVRLRGVDSATLLAKVCAVDLSDSVTPNGAAFRSSVARVVTDVVRDDQNGVPSYLLHCERSSGQYLFDCLLDAGAEFGIEIGAFSSPAI